MSADESTAGKDEAEARSASSSTRRALLQRARQRLAAVPRQAPERTAEWLLMEVLGCNRVQLHTRPDAPVDPEDRQQYAEWVDRRVNGEPLQHILGYTSFRGLRIEVSPDVMIPRPETEEVVGTALELIEDTEAPRILDVGTGSGCIALALKHERPDATVHACDVSPKALQVARSNANQLGLDICLVEADLFGDTFLDRMPGRLDLLVSNPPYIPVAEADTLSATVREYDPARALFTRGDPLRFYWRLASVGQALCRAGGSLVLEGHADYAHDAADILRGRGMEEVRVEEDVSGRPRILRGRPA
ncbi:MAG: peptide chain release factor N(5)-glutamine methyltransferase [Salinibacter sp.]